MIPSQAAPVVAARSSPTNVNPVVSAHRSTLQQAEKSLDSQIKRIDLLISETSASSKARVASLFQQMKKIIDSHQSRLLESIDANDAELRRSFMRSSDSNSLTKSMRQVKTLLSSDDAGLDQRSSEVTALLDSIEQMQLSLPYDSSQLIDVQGPDNDKIVTAVDHVLKAVNFVSKR